MSSFLLQLPTAEDAAEARAFTRLLSKHERARRQGAAKGGSEPLSVDRRFTELASPCPP